jgi:hypothetical protein
VLLETVRPERLRRLHANAALRTQLLLQEFQGCGGIES